MMQLDPCLIPDWPKLAWVARFSRGVHEIVVFHGPMVETSSEWLVEKKYWIKHSICWNPPGMKPRSSL